MAQKPSIPKGTRDFSPSEVNKRNYIFDVVKKHFQTYGFQPIETPSFENSETLMGKYGDEGDRLIFKILNSGDFFGKFYKLLIESITAALIYHHDAVLDFTNNWTSEEIDLEAYKKNFFEDFSKHLKKESAALFSDEKIAEDKLLEDLWYVLIEHTVKTDEKQKSFLKKEKAELKPYSYLIYADFSYRFLNSYSGYISEKALRYDLTVPFARYVVMHQNEIDFPFKRYQIQPVWRADRPQKGRFREFFQCDADVVGSDSLLQEVELVQLYDAVFTDLKLDGVTIKLNNRKILAGIAEVIGERDKLIDFTVALDKLDKIGIDGVSKEMREKNISEAAINKAAPLFALKGTNLEQLSVLGNLLKDSEEGSKGVGELRFIIETLEELGLQSANLKIDVTLARGLNYYTGAIFEVAAPEGVSMGSIGGGGRYDDLTGIFGLKDVSGVGISFGLDRIYLVLEELGLFPEAIDQSLQVLCVNFGDKEALTSLKLVNQLRRAGIKCDLYPSSAKMQKQMKYANNRNVPYVVLIGEKEISDNSFVVRDMVNGGQTEYSLNNVDQFLKQL
tara:strand:- start:6449 stop:8131 length:1683 start_codon:yes stop_codon:yes gene_type:complete